MVLDVQEVGYMFDYLCGKLVEVRAPQVVLDVQGVGYVVILSRTDSVTLERSLEKPVQVYIHMHVQQDGNVLYGFLDKQQRALFWDLLGVNGVGPKLAQNILEALSPQGFVQAVQMRDAQKLQKVVGVGKKVADRVVTELQNSKSFQSHNLVDSVIEGTTPLQLVQPYLLNAGFKEGAVQGAFKELGERSRGLTAEELTKALIEQMCKNTHSSS